MVRSLLARADGAATRPGAALGPGILGGRGLAAPWSAARAPRRAAVAGRARRREPERRRPNSIADRERAATTTPVGFGRRGRRCRPATRAAVEPRCPEHRADSASAGCARSEPAQTAAAARARRRRAATRARQGREHVVRGQPSALSQPCGARRRSRAPARSERDRAGEQPAPRRGPEDAPGGARERPAERREAQREPDAPQQGAASGATASSAVATSEQGRRAATGDTSAAPGCRAGRRAAASATPARPARRSAHERAGDRRSDAGSARPGRRGRRRARSALRVEHSRELERRRGSPGSASRQASIVSTSALGQVGRGAPRAAAPAADRARGLRRASPRDRVLARPAS